MGAIAATANVISDDLREVVGGQPPDAITGEINQRQLTEVLRTTLEEAIKLRSSCCFLLAAIDDFDRIKETHGSDIGDAVIAAVAKRIRAQLRGKDHLGRCSDNMFGVVINDCTPTDMLTAAERLLVGARDEVVPTETGPVAITVSIGGVTLPRYGRTVQEALTCAQHALDDAKAKGPGSFQPYRPKPATRNLALAS